MRENVSIKAMRILVVEDNELNREIATTILSDEGAIITGAKIVKKLLISFHLPLQIPLMPF